MAPKRRCGNAVKLAEIFEVPVSQLLGSRIEPDAQTDALEEQLARINEQTEIIEK